MNLGFPSSLPLWLVVLLTLLIVIEVALLIAGLVAVLKTDEARLTLPRVGWILIVVLLSIVGPIAFFVAGRKRPSDLVDAAGADHASARSAIDSLYGKQ